MQSIKKSTAMCALSFSFLSGCTSLTVNQNVSRYETEAKPVMTEYSQALSCVGQLIGESDEPSLTVYVRDIDDETVPTRFRERRLSKGGAWWFHTAIDKMQSERVTSTLKSPSKEQRADSNFLVLSGAWTQDDNEVGNNRKSFGFNNLGSGLLDRFGWSNNQQVSVIAGDFASTINNRVVHASAISIAVSSVDNDYELRIDDGSRRFDLGLTNDINEGPQFAQRRIAEAAALVHVARAFDVDYRSCIEEDWSNPTHYRKKMNDYRKSSVTERYEITQSALRSAGYYNGSIDGQWGAQSEQALALFLTDKGLPPNGEPSMEVYGLLLKHILGNTIA